MKLRGEEKSELNIATVASGLLRLLVFVVLVTPVVGLYDRPYSCKQPGARTGGIAVGMGGIFSFTLHEGKVYQMSKYASGYVISIIAQATAEQSLDLWISAAKQLDRLQYAAIILLACRVFTVDLESSGEALEWVMVSVQVVFFKCYCNARELKPLEQASL